MEIARYFSAVKERYGLKATTLSQKPALRNPSQSDAARSEKFRRNCIKMATPKSCGVVADRAKDRGAEAGEGILDPSR